MNDSLSPALLTSLIFGAALLANLLVKFWLASRQIRAVARHRGAVPTEFAQTITLASHQLAEAMYASATQDTQAQTGGPQAAGAADDNVVDAEFEEVRKAG